MEEHDRHHKKGFHLKKSQIWQGVSGILALLLIISIFTNGFSFKSGVDAAISNLEKAVVAEKSDSIKSQLATIKDDLVTLKSQITPTSTVTPTGQKSASAAKLDFYVMSQCPYGLQVENAIKPVLDQLGANVDFKINFIADDNGDGTFKSLHGENEVKGNIVQLCAMKYNPDKYMDMIVCQNKASSSIPGNWESCATGLAVDKIKTCYEGEEGKTLLRESIAATDKVGATGSPTIYLNGNKYSGGRTNNDFLRALCNELSPKPEACTSIPEATKVNVITLNDKRCKECDTTGIIGQLKSLFPGLVVKNLDYSDAEGKKLYSDLSLKNLPAILFDSTVEKGEGYANVQNYLEPAGQYQNLKIGASFDPKAEICDNGIDDNSDKKIDCDDPTCTGNTLCRKDTPKKLDLFVMSQCPYGLQAMNAMKDVLTTFKGNMDFSIHYIAEQNADGTFTSLHGQAEVDENIRELCAMKYYPKDYKYMDYIWCRNKAISSTDWETCAKEAGMSTQMLKTCAEGTEGKDLLAKDLKLAQELQISASPSWLANNKVEFSGIDAATVQSNFCKSNTGVAGCEKTIVATTPTTTTPAGSCG